MNLILVGFGGAFGSICRYLLGVLSMRTLGPGYPWGTYAANVIGGLLMGLLVGVLACRGGADQEKWRLLLGVGALGGFTTFSSFSLEVVRMLETRNFIQAAGYVAGSVVLAIGAVFLGMLLARRAFA
jgi:CrcB protein